MRTIIRPRDILLAVTLSAGVSVLTLGAADLSRRDAMRAASDDFWGHFYVRALEVEYYDTLGSMAVSSDAIVIGRVAQVARSRSFGSPPSNMVTYAVMTIETLDVVSAHLDIGDRIALEVMLPDGLSITHVSSQLPTEPAMFFLRNKGLEARGLGESLAQQAEDAPYYRLVVSQGLFRNFDGQVGVPVGSESAFVLEWRDRPFADLVGAVRDAVD